MYQRAFLCMDQQQKQIGFSYSIPEDLTRQMIATELSSDKSE